MSVIEIEGVSKSYGAIKALSSVNLEIKTGEIFGLLGPNGAGKTTLLSILEGLIKPEGGRVKLFGMEYGNSRTKIHKRIGVQLQSTSFIPELNLIEQIIVMGGLYGLKITKNRATELLKSVGLDSRGRSYPQELSGGQRQRLSILMAIVHKPEILILDEPTNGLDPQTKLLLWKLFKELKEEGMTIIVTTHNIQEAESVCDRVAIINNGEIVAVDTPSALIDIGDGLSVVTVSSGLSGFDIANSCSGVRNTDFNNNTFRITTSDVIGTVKDLFEVAGNSNTYLGNLHIKQPSLEDVFLSLTGTSLSGFGEVNE